MGNCFAQKKLPPEIEQLLEKNLIQELNKILIETFYEDVLVAKNLDLIDQYFDSNLSCIQHSPYISDGVPALKEFFTHWFEQGYQLEVLSVVADEDLVFVHAKYEEEEAAGSSRLGTFVDIYRVSEGKIAEHWDLIQFVDGAAGGVGVGSYANKHPFF